jgi:hypothetical protein
MLSRSIRTYAAPSAPLAGTARFRCSAAYTPCLRCTFPPRRPTTGSVLSLLILSQHVVLRDSGESGGCMHPVPSPPTLAFVPLVQTRHSHSSRKSVPRGGHISELHYGSLALQPADLFTLLTDRTGFASSHRGFYYRASDGLVTRSVAGYRYGGNWVISTGGTYTRENGS